MGSSIEKESWIFSGRQCDLYTFGEPEFLLLQAVDEHERNYLGQEAEYIAAMTESGFALAAFMVKDWNTELSPWDAPAVFRGENFGCGAEDTLHFIEHEWLPELKQHMNPDTDIPVILGGYSLAGLFSLWCVYQTGLFSAAAAASPSVWFPGWLDFAEREEPRADCIYLSLGDKEKRARNKLMARVADCIQRQYEILQNNPAVKTCILEWNPGNHFQETELRTAKAFSWCIDKLRLTDDPVQEEKEV